MTCRDTQKADLAGKTKLTAVSMRSRGRAVTRFVMVEHDERGKAMLKPSQLDQVVSTLNLRRGNTFSHG